MIGAMNDSDDGVKVRLSHFISENIADRPGLGDQVIS